MTFDRWIELITLALAVVAGIYAALMVVMKPFTDRLQDIAQSMKDSSQRIERLFDSQNTLREDFITSRSEHKVINERLDNVEGDVRELKNK
ncbi:viral envelope fusion with host membrane [Lactobacillus phage Lb]|uniref:Viral envelope fusion with host membrane n=1 Tax=Lactobacillus phage Lb TaxID=2048517 RepID=A0A2Z2U835_9CAUD|nr:viral envelope fusion with host membrane [Lactobacillus phage Lb]ATN94213.1 viral envelope fusion with host membrane [Lactobacillus phage Lb]